MLAITGLTGQVTGADREYPGGAFTLVDHNERTVTEADFRGRLLLVLFGYTYCPDMCPMVLNDLALALEIAGTDADDTAVLFITVDPARDTPPVLAAYVAAFHPAIVGLTGTPHQVRAAADAFGAQFARVETGDGPYLMDHSAFVHLFDSEGSYLSSLLPGLPPDDIAQEIRSHLAAQPAADGTEG